MIPKWPISTDPANSLDSLSEQKSASFRSPNYSQEILDALAELEHSEDPLRQVLAAYWLLTQYSSRHPNNAPSGKT